MTEKKTIAEKIRSIRKACGFTQQQVAAVLNVDRSTYTYYETGQNDARHPYGQIACQSFNLSVDDLLSDEAEVSQMNDVVSPEPPDEENLLPETANRLTRTERELLLYYRALPIQERVKMMQILHDLAKETNTEK